MARERTDGPTLRDRLTRRGRPLLLDGATGTELERAGITTSMPLWSTHALLEAPEAVLAVHRRYAEAGAEILTANTFRTQARTLARAGLKEPERQDRELTRLAVELAVAARGARPAGADRGPIFVAGSQPPLEDCFQPELAPATTALQREHVRHAELLAEAGVDLILVETMSSIREAVVAVASAVATGLPVVTGFVSWERDRILSGEPLQEAAARALDAGALVVGVNCLPLLAIPAALRSLAALGAPLLCAPNLGQPKAESGFTRSPSASLESFATSLGQALELEVDPPARIAIAGGCCGTTPAHIESLARHLALPGARPCGPSRRASAQI